jgi:hypothetical protein
MERRTGHRYDLSFPVTIDLPGSPRSELQDCRTRDISAHGIYFRVSEDLAVGTRINMIVTLSAEMANKKRVSVRVRGRVVRIDKTRIDGRESRGIAAVIEWYDIFRGELPNWNKADD